MSLQVYCQQCGRLLSVDEGFSGGYCRCIHCKAITFVPPVANGGQAAPRPDTPGRRTILSPPMRIPARVTGRKTDAAAPDKPPEAPIRGPRNRLNLWLIGVGLLLAILVGMMVAWMQLKS